MIVGLRTVGIGVSDVRRALAWAIDRNEVYYRSRIGQIGDPLAGLTYMPDPVADRVVIVCAEAFGGGPLSCGSAAAAWCAWQRAHDRYSYVRLRGDGPSWHAYVETPRGVPAIWDPAVEMRRR